MSLGPAYGGNTSIANLHPDSTLYIKGDEFTDGSIRMIPDLSLGTEAEFQLRTSGVWNDTGIQIAASTVFLGRDLEVKGAGDWIHTTDIQGELSALIPHIEFNDDEGSDAYAHVPILTPLQEKVPIQPNFSQEIVTSSYDAAQVNPAELLAKRVHYKTGSVAATQPLTISFLRPAGTVFWTRNFPASAFPASPPSFATNDGGDALFTSAGNTLSVSDTADHSLFSESTYNGSHTVTFVSGDTYKVGLSYTSNDSGLLATTVTIELLGLLEGFTGETIETSITSTAPFSLLGLAGEAYTLLDFYLISEENIVTFETGLDNIITSFVGKDVMVNVNGNLMNIGAPC